MTQVAEPTKATSSSTTRIHHWIGGQRVGSGAGWNQPFLGFEANLVLSAGAQG